MTQEPLTLSNVRKPARSKTSSGRKRDTLSSLRQHVDEIFRRLKDADHMTQKSILSLETAFKILERRVGEDSTVNKAALTRRIDQLSEHLTGLISDTQRAVASDLKAVLSNPSEARLRAAIEAADARVSQTEMSQADALTRINRHISELAKAVDARFELERQEREDAIDRVAASLQSRFSGLEQSSQSAEKMAKAAEFKAQEVEKSSAKAVSDLGQRIAKMSDDFNKRTDHNTQAIGAKLSDIAVKTQGDFEAFRNSLERRIESLEDNQRNLDSYTDRSLANLSGRIDSLEYGLTSAAEALTRTPENIQHTPDASPPPIVDDAFSPVNQYDDSPYSAGTPVLTVVHDAASSPDIYAPQNPNHQDPYQPDTYGVDNYTPQTYQPQEFVPNEYVPSGHHPVPSSPTFAAPPPDEPLSYAHSPHAEGGFDAPGAPPEFLPQDLGDTGHTHAAPGEEFTIDDVPYDNPAYAELSADGGMDRPGAFKGKAKKARPSLPISGRNLKVAGFAIAVAAVGYFALRGFSGPTNVQSGDGLFVEDGGASSSAPIATAQRPDGAQPGVDPAGGATGAAPIGEYQDNQGLSAEGAPSTATALQQAASDGDAAAQFQLGLSYLQGGQTEDGVRLIRSAANKGQPAAQYRLAKLYESGEGVEADPAIARQLTERAARAGNRIAMHDLALYYAEGRGDVDVNIATAGQWFEKAAERGVVDSQFNLGVLYESGQGLPKNLVNAYVWYSIAAAQGDQFARQRVDILKEQLSEADLKRAQGRADNFKPTRIDEEANGIFRNAAWNPNRNGTTGPATSQIKEAQTLLGQLGFDTGTPDGAMGPKTRKAIISFQRTQGLDQTGQVDMALIRELERASGV